MFPETWDLSRTTQSEHTVSVPVQRGRLKISGRAIRWVYGATLILEHITETVGLRSSLKQIFEVDESLVDDSWYPSLDIVFISERIGLPADSLPGVK